MESKLLFIYFYWQESDLIFQAGETPLTNENSSEFYYITYDP